MSNRVRFVEFERGEINLKTGEFPMILATDGEASDGDILSIEGAQFGARAPLQLSHVNDPRSTAGSVSGFRRDLQSTPKKLKARGQIELEGDGPAAEIRRDVAFMVSKGHVTGISVRWEPIEYMRRVNLPADHPAYVDDAAEKDWRKRYGIYFKKWRVLEGSIVAVQADQEAMIGRAQETEGAVAAFWRAMAQDARARDEIESEGRSAPQPPIEPTPEPEPPAEETPESEPETPAEMPPAAAGVTNAGRLAAFAAQIREFKALGIDVADLAAVVESERAAPEPTVAELNEKVSSLERKLAALDGRVAGSPPEPQSWARSLRDLVSESRTQHENDLEDLRAYIDEQRGRVLDEARRARAARIKERIEEIRSGE